MRDLNIPRVHIGLWYWYAFDNYHSHVSNNGYITGIADLSPHVKFHKCRLFFKLQMQTGT